MSASANTAESGPWKVRYKYVSPPPAGPFVGGYTSKIKYCKGDQVRAPFGAAVVISCRAVTGATP